MLTLVCGLFTNLNLDLCILKLAMEATAEILIKFGNRVRELRKSKKLSQEEVWIRKGVKARRTRNEGRVRALEKMREEKKAQRQQIGNFYDSETGQKMIASKDGLAKIEGEISMQWSGELYKNVLRKLAEKGYSLN